MKQINLDNGKSHPTRLWALALVSALIGSIGGQVSIESLNMDLKSLQLIAITLLLTKAVALTG